MNEVSTNSADKPQTAGVSSAGMPQVSTKALLTGFLFIVCATAHVTISAKRTPKSEVELGAAIPVSEVTAITKSPDIIEVDDRPDVIETKESDWKNMHLANRHYATLESVSGQSELNYLCMEEISCGWVMKLKAKNNCNKDNKGQEFRVRLDTDKVVRDYESRCGGYGLIFVGTKAGDSKSILDMVINTDVLKINSVGNAGVFRTQYFDSYGAADALDTAIVSAGL